MMTVDFYFQRFYKKAAAFVLRAVAKHSPALAQSVVDCGALDALVICLEEFDPGVKEAAAWALGYIARHNAGTVLWWGVVSECCLCLLSPPRLKNGRGVLNWGSSTASTSAAFACITGNKPISQKILNIGF